MRMGRNIVILLHVQACYTQFYGNKTKNNNKKKQKKRGKDGMRRGRSLVILYNYVKPLLYLAVLCCFSSPRGFLRLSLQVCQ